MSDGLIKTRSHGRICSKMKPAFSALLEAMDYARDTGSDRWEFAVPIRQFQELGLTETDLRWLVRKGYVEHGREITRQGDKGREFRPTGDLTFSRRTCFVLTADGICKARSVVDSQTIVAHDVENPNERKTQTEELLPHWDAETRELRLNGLVVKRFKWRAANQETILSAFQEESWPRRIDDPLAPQPEQDSKRRLCDAIKCLNRKQINPLLHFRGDGTGEGVVWERIDEPEGPL